MNCKHDRLAYSSFSSRVICLECGQDAEFAAGAAKEKPPFTFCGESPRPGESMAELRARVMSGDVAERKLATFDDVIRDARRDRGSKPAAPFDKMAAAVKDTRDGWHTFDDAPPVEEGYFAARQIPGDTGCDWYVTKIGLAVSGRPNDYAYWHRDTIGVPPLPAAAA